MARRAKVSNAIAAKKTPAKGALFCWMTLMPVTQPGVKQQIIAMAMNTSGIRDTARVLHVSPTTVIKALKKKSRSRSR
jgi:transposase-like protein